MPAAGGDTTADQSAKQEQARKDEKVRQLRETIAKRKAELEARRKTEDNARIQAAEATKKHDADEDRRAEEARRKQAQNREQQQSERRTVQQICADRPNFISRGICEARECTKAEHAKSAFCSQMSDRPTPSGGPQGY